MVPGGRTPEASLNSAVTQDIKKREAASESQRFRSHGRGYYSLAQPSDPLHGAVGRQNQEVRTRLRVLLGEMDPKTFEHLVGELLIALGFEDVNVTRYVGDRGIDVRATLSVGGVTDVKTAIQVKRYTTSSIGAPTVRELRGGLGPHDRGLIITLSRFSRDAKREASEPDRSPISLVDGQELIELLIQKRIGVSPRNVTILELDEDYFADGAGGNNYDSEVDTPVDSFKPPRLIPQEARAKTMWPLPGGGDAWKNTLDMMLQHISDEAPTMEKAVIWLIGSFERVHSSKVARGYWNVLRGLGLIETHGEQVSATSLGREYLDDPTNILLLNIMRNRILGVEEMLSWLAERPHTMDDLLGRFQDTIGVRWTTTEQIKYRLGWLEVLSAADQTHGEWHMRTGQ